MKRTLALALTVFGLAACDEQVCNLIGCSSGVDVALPGLASDDGYDVDVGGDLVGAFRCVAGNGGFVVEDGSATGDFATDTATPSCGADAFTLRAEPQPTSLTITVTAGTDSRSVDVDDIVFTEQQPNGPDCEPTCRNASVVLAAPTA